MQFKTIIEPFRIKSVEPLRLTTEEERREFLQAAHYNPFLLKSDDVLIDLLTDSGTSAMSTEQWSAMMRGDESYAGASSWFRLEEEIKDLTGYPYILPTHQGRAAERILYGHLGGPEKIFISNTHFDTTRANIEFSGATAIDIPVEPQCITPGFFPFNGNIDTEKLEELILRNGSESIGAVILTVTNNSGGGQPVSMKNASEVNRICKKHNVHFILDACRVAENSYFIREHEEGFEHMQYREIARMMFELADGCIMSAKKDALVNMGGFLAVREESLAEACTNSLIITEGFATYGGLSGRSMEALAVGLREVFEPEYLDYRIRSTSYLGKKLADLGVPVILPTGGHAVYINAAEMYPQIPVQEYPGQTLVCDLYLLGGIRCVEVGSVMFGKYDENGNLIPAPRELVRLAIPRRVYTQSHIDYIVEVFEHLMARRQGSTGFAITKEAKYLRHFTAFFEPLRSEEKAV